MANTSRSDVFANPEELWIFVPTIQGLVIIQQSYSQMKAIMFFCVVSLFGLFHELHSQTAPSTLDADRARLEKKMNEMRKSAEEEVYDYGTAERARSEVKMFKGRHPEQDVSSYEAEIRKFIADGDKYQADEEEKDENGEAFEDAYEEAMVEAYSSPNVTPAIGNDVEIAKMQSEVNRINSTIEAFVKSDVGQSAAELDPESISNVTETIGNANTELSTRIPALRDQMVNGHDRRYTTGAYFEMLVLEKFWTANGTLFPSNATVKSAISKITALHREIGSMETVEANRKKNYATYLTTVTMEPAGGHDAAIESEMKRLFLNTGWTSNETVTKVNLRSDNYVIKRHEISGVITCRTRECQVVTKDSQGRCWVHRFGLIQDYNGSGYESPSALYNVDEKYEILCSNVR